MASYYNRDQFYEQIISSLKENEINNPERKNLSVYDEFHTGGAIATKSLLQHVNIKRHHHVLDIGCGIGGPARMIADEHKCKVTGIDITPENIRTARLFTDLLKMKNVDFLVADATSLPFENENFDVVWTQHVQMNIADKKSFYKEIARVLKSKGCFIYYDIFLGSTEEIIYPMPWASGVEDSFLIFPEETVSILNSSGLFKTSSLNHTEDVIQILEKTMLAPLHFSQQLLLGENAERKVKNLLLALKRGDIRIESAVFLKA